MCGNRAFWRRRPLDSILDPREILPDGAPRDGTRRRLRRAALLEDLIQVVWPHPIQTTRLLARRPPVLPPHRGAGLALRLCEVCGGVLSVVWARVGLCVLLGFVWGVVVEPRQPAARLGGAVFVSLEAPAAPLEPFSLVDAVVLERALHARGQQLGGVQEGELRVRLSSGDDFLLPEGVLVEAVLRTHADVRAAQVGGEIVVARRPVDVDADGRLREHRGSGNLLSS
eukprot:CAMPEP_0206268092 /NCGR_PEP_ID=MMETSP0047_2-20121206/31514_1 /ASSEMBLY_ACC=CAM_ASM_000192 /TAXON_ID=195065 /ORGANISM="Chroomonas mesostigmatica_cf, Strain CCMP1168" /LENGTH=226 /DNA_ID=CAMNT_0053696371 /DNA_START=164 /DNA_END=845 /DNA_ORIENTATION=-